MTLELGGALQAVGILALVRIEEVLVLGKLLEITEMTERLCTFQLQAN